MKSYNHVGRDLTTHEGALDYVLNHLHHFEIDRKNIAWMLKEPAIFRDGELHRVKSCDAVLGYTNPYNYSEEIELKRSRRSRGKAKIQMRSTSDNFCNIIGFPVQRKIIIYYPIFDYEVLHEK